MGIVGTNESRDPMFFETSKNFVEKCCLGLSSPQLKRILTNPCRINQTRYVHAAIHLAAKTHVVKFREISSLRFPRSSPPLLPYHLGGLATPAILRDMLFRTSLVFANKCDQSSWNLKHTKMREIDWNAWESRRGDTWKAGIWLILICSHVVFFQTTINDFQ